jgi:hypothetical protein
VDDDVRPGPLNLAGVKAVFSHETTRSLDLRIKSCYLLRYWAHGVSVASLVVYKELD